MFHVVCEIGPPPPVPVGRAGVGARRWEAPVLTAGEEVVGRRPDRDSLDVVIGRIPDVVPHRVGAYRQIEQQPDAPVGETPADGGDLQSGLPLSVGVAPLPVRAHGGQRARDLTGLFDRGAEVRVSDHVRTSGEELTELRLATGRKRGGCLGQPPVGDASDLLPVHQRRRSGLDGARAGPLPGQVEQGVVPMPPRDRCVGARVKRAVEVRRQQRQRRHQIAAVVRDPVAEAREVTEVPGAEIRTVTQRVHRREDAPMARARAAPAPGRRGDHMRVAGRGPDA